MERVIKSNDACDLTASSHRDSTGSQVLKDGNTFLLLDRLGEAGIPEANEQGLYHEGTRYLSRWGLTIGGCSAMLLNSTIKEDNSLMLVEMTTKDLTFDNGTAIPHGSLHLSRSVIVHGASLHDELRVTNYGGQGVSVNIAYQFDADYCDLFEVRGAKRSRRGDDLDPEFGDRWISLGYQGLDFRTRRTSIDFDRDIKFVDGRSGVMTISLKAGEETCIHATVSCTEASGKAPHLSHEEATSISSETIRVNNRERTSIVTSNERFNQWLDRSYADLQMLVSRTEYGIYPYAGVPWFATPFGRDGIITALETLWFQPELAKGTLQFLAKTQATEIDPASEAEPGKIIHEMRDGEMAELGEIPFRRYYGTVDATPLFVILAGQYYRRTGDRDFIQTIWPNIQAALHWIDYFGDGDGDGFIEYQSHNDRGLVHQCWKDSNDSIFHADGSDAVGPIAVSEVQGYVYEAKLLASEMADLFGQPTWAKTLRSEAIQLKRRFNKAFWAESLGTFAIALDGSKNRCEVLNSNAGHLLYTGIVADEYAERVCDALTDRRSFNGWGIRTIAEGEARYNPMSYHNGSIWPHDTAIGIAGAARYGFRKRVMPIAEGLFNASLFNELHRLPELFCGFDRKTGHGPTLYPVACSPQAWAAGSAFLVLQSLLGLSFSSSKPQIRFDNPVLPVFLNWVQIENLRTGNGSVDLVLRRHPRDVGLSVERKEGDIEIVVFA